MKPRYIPRKTYHFNWEMDFFQCNMELTGLHYTSRIGCTKDEWRYTLDSDFLSGLKNAFKFK